MNVLVTGGTGFIGTALCEHLADRGHGVTALSRSADEATVPDGVDSYGGDVTDYDAIEGAFEGQDAVVNLVALTPLFVPKGGEREHFRVTLGGAKNVVRAAEEHGVGRLVHQSALGADRAADSHYLRAKGEAEAVVRESDLEWVILRPSIVFGEGAEFLRFVKLVSTPYVTPLPGGGREMRFQPIWIGDFVEIVAACVEDDDRAGETYELGGPEVLDLAEITKLIYRAEGKSVKIVPVPIALSKLGMTMGEYVPLFPMGRDQASAFDFDNMPADNDVDAFGIDAADLRTLGDYLGLPGA